MGASRQVARVAVVCTLAGAAAAPPAHAQNGGGPGNHVGQAVQQVARALPEITLPRQAQPPAPAPTAPAPVPPAPAPGGPGPAPAAPDPAPAAPAPAPKPAAPGPGGPASPATPDPAPRPDDRAAPDPRTGGSSGLSGGDFRRGPSSRGAGPGSPSSPLGGVGPETGHTPAEARPASGRVAASGAKTTAAQSGESAGAAAQSGESAGAAARSWESADAIAQSGASGGAGAQTGDLGAGATADPVATGAQSAEGSSSALPFTGSAAILLAAIGLLGWWPDWRSGG